MSKAKISCMVVEDEPLAAKIITDYIKQVPFLELKASFKDAIYATEYLQKESIDLVFLDIHLPKLKGMAFLKTLVNPPAIIITTAYHQYAVEGFELNVTDYLLKPIEFERFLTAVNKVVKQTEKDSSETKPAEPAKNHFYITVNRKNVKVLFDDILYVESLREYIKLVTKKGTHVTKMSTHEVEAILPPSQFQRIHRSFIVSLSKIDSFSSEEVEIGNISIPVGRLYKDVLSKF
jgi:DNA-binding LytR/AlgR family response regulator